jgi:putative membrane protein
VVPDDEPADRYPEASRRTYFAEERTLLAWWRTGIAAAAVALGVGGLVPHLSGLPRTRFLALGAGYGALALIFVVGGTIRAARSHRALAKGSYAALPNGVMAAVATYVSALIVLTVVALF